MPKSVMTNRFNEVPVASIPRSSFDRTHGYKTTFNAGYLVPFYLDEALPGDTFNLRMTGFARLATPIKPIMDNMFMDTHFFAVPKRLVWDNWEKFNGQQDNPGDSVDYVIPTQTAPSGTGFPENTTADYLGLPIGVEGITVNTLPFRCYNLIYNEWFRDQNIQNSVTVPKDDATDSTLILRRRGKRHDYFTSCLPWPQKPGLGQVVLPLGSTAPVAADTGIGAADTPDVIIGSVDPVGGRFLTGNLPNVQMNVANNQRSPNLVADLSNATAATINELRHAFQVQKMQERDARGGTRYTEIIRSHFGVVSPDARLQRPEFLGGGSTYVNINPVEQKAPPQGTDPTATTPQGNLAATGTASMSGHGFTKSFTEHCYILGFVSVRADLTYQDGIDRLWNRRTRNDFYWPALSHIGEQAVLNKEIYAQGTSVDDQVFGYQERYAEYRYKPSKITGKFRSKAENKLDYWHLGQDFSSLPVLQSTFIQENPPVDRVIAVQDEPHFLFDAYVQLRCARPMPVYGVPGLIDHF